MSRVPVYTLSLLALAAVAAAIPSVGALLVYDRDAILKGELWRLLSGHLVHFSVFHLIADQFALGGAGCLIERRLRRATVWLYLAMAGAIGIALLLFEPRLARFGGLSGLAYGSVFYLALSHLRRGMPARALALTVLSALLLKLLVDGIQPVSFLGGPGFQSFVPVPLSHLIGVIVAGAWLVVSPKENHCVPAETSVRRPGSSHR